ncbi:MAG: hypothetical protein HN985_05055 [Planctomycetaceae bacterium]|nr:hypothetical protein [Planctomycetaceae bacterium]
MAKKQQKQQRQPSIFRKLLLYGIGGSVIGAILVYSFRGPNLAAETMSMQQKVLMEGKDFASSKEEIREIMQNIDLMPSKEIYKVRKDLGRSVGQLSKQSAEKYLQLGTAERAAFLDEGIEKMQLAKALFDATNQGGMPTRTQADAERYKQYREEREAAKRNPHQSKAKKPGDDKKKKLDDGEKKKPTVTPEKVYFEALLKRAEEKNIDLGRFGRYYGGGRRRRP